MPPLIVFDLDNTLAESKQPITDSMASLLAALLARAYVAVISGGALVQFEKQVVARLPAEADRTHLFLLPTSGAALYRFQDAAWRNVYEETLRPAERTEIETAMQEIGRAHIDFSAPAYGARIEYRGSQVSLSALGQEAPLALKKAWDPDKTKRRALQAALQAALPGYTVRMGGSTTIDVTRRGIDKAYGLRKLCVLLALAEEEALYVGDELVAGGNDEAIFATGARTHAVASPADTETFIRTLLSS